MPASAAEMTKASMRYLVTLMPTDSAAMRLSRMAMIARPERLLIRLSTTMSVKMTRRKPASKEASFLTPMAPIGPLMTMLPGRFGSRKLKLRFAPSKEKYTQLSRLRMISPKARVTMAR